MWLVDSVKRILMVKVLLWRKKLPEFCEADQSKNINSGTLIRYVMVVAKLMLRCGIHIVFAKIVKSMKIWTNNHLSIKSG